jgi:hypothetical protein
LLLHGRPLKRRGGLLLLLYGLLLRQRLCGKNWRWSVNELLLTRLRRVNEVLLTGRLLLNWRWLRHRSRLLYRGCLLWADWCRRALLLGVYDWLPTGLGREEGWSRLGEDYLLRLDGWLLFAGECDEQLSIVSEEGRLPTLAAMEDDGDGWSGSGPLQLRLHRERVPDDAVWLEPGEREGDDGYGGRDSFAGPADRERERRLARVFVSERPSHGALEMIVGRDKLGGRGLVPGVQFRSD